MKNLIVIFVVIAVITAGCKNDKKDKNSEEPMNETYEAIFIDVNAAVIDTAIDTNATQEYRKLPNLNLTTSDHFWGSKKNFFVRGLGALIIEDPGTYYFKLTSSGSAKIQLNNVDLVVHTDFHQKAEKLGQRVLKKGITIFDFEYFPGEEVPYLVLEWSKDGIAYEPIPDEVFASSDLGVTEVFTDAEQEGSPINTLSKEELADGWKLLFDGTTMKGWHTYNNPGVIGKKWVVEDGLLKI